MAKHGGNRPAEIFGYPIWNQSKEAQDVRERHWCPFINRSCDKKSRLIDFPFGVCSVEQRGGVHTTYPHRFEEQGSTEGIPRVLDLNFAQNMGGVYSVIFCTI